MDIAQELIGKGRPIFSAWRWTTAGGARITMKREAFIEYRLWIDDALVAEVEDTREISDSRLRAEVERYVRSLPTRKERERGAAEAARRARLKVEQTAEARAALETFREPPTPTLGQLATLAVAGAVLVLIAWAISNLVR